MSQQLPAPSLHFLIAPEPPPEVLPEPNAEQLALERGILERDFPQQRKAILNLRRRNSLQGDSAALRAEIGEKFFVLDLFDSAEYELLQALQLDPLLGRTHLLLGEIYRQRPQHARALWHLERARECMPRDIDVLIIEVMVLRELGDLEPAAQLIELGLALSPKHPDLQVQAARLALDNAQPELAVSLLEQAVVASPDHLRAHQMLGEALYALGQEQRAREELTIHERLTLLKKAGVFDLARSMPEWERAAVLASHHLLTGDGARAREELARSESLLPGNPESGVVEAQLLYQEGDEAGALARLEAVLSAHPDHLRALRSLGVYLCESPDPARRDLTRGLELAQRALQVAIDAQQVLDAPTFLALARCQRASGDLEAARYSLQTALRIDGYLQAAKDLLAELETESAK